MFSSNMDYSNGQFTLTVGEMIVKKDRYTMELIKESLYSVRMILSIVDFRESDQGRFSCRAKNSMGQSSIESGTIRIYAIYGKHGSNTFIRHSIR